MSFLERWFEDFFIHTLKDIVIDEESDYVNVGEECPSCSSVDGYKIVGQVAPYCAECDKEEEDVEVEETKVVEESLNEKRETGLADVVQQMLDGEFYDVVKRPVRCSQ